jgi:imidazole glycerol-phosphate synthase subunit HisH
MATSSGKMIGIIDYGMGNLQSVKNALDSLDIPSAILQTPEEAGACDRLILPGVGAFGHAIANLKKAGWIEPIRQWAEEGKPFLGICLGMQLLAERGTEFGDNDGLCLIPGLISHLEAGSLVVPHMGWNSLKSMSPHPILQDVAEDADVYFVHSFVFRTDPQNVIAWCDYGERFAAIVAKGSVVGTQFHPEKSQGPGLAILKSFALWQPALVS